MSCHALLLLPALRWVVHKHLPQSVQPLQRVPATGTAAAAGVLPVQIRQYVPAQADGVPSSAAAVVNEAGQVVALPEVPASVRSRTDQEVRSGSSSAGSSSGAAVASQFASYEAAVGELAPGLLHAVRQLLYGSHAAAV